MKKALAYIGTVILTWAGLWLALFVNIAEHDPYGQGGLSVLSAILFAAALLCAGYGNSITWKGETKSGGRR